MEPDNDTVKDKPTVLLVDDNQINVAIARKMLQKAGYTVRACYSGEDALEMVADELPDIILLDIMMPGMDGMDTARILKESEQTRDVPIIFLSALSEAEVKVRGFELGGVDYVTKPFQENEMLARVNTHIRMSRLERERIEHIRVLEELNEEKDKMMQIVSHDLRSPLGGVKGLAEILRDGDEAGDPKVVRDFSSMICTAVESLLVLVNDILDLAKIESGSMSLNLDDFELRELLMACIESIQMIAFKKGVHIEHKLGDTEIFINADRPKLMQVFNNLISNAVKFTPQGGKIFIALQQQDKRVCLQFRDTGIGIPEDLLPKLFEKFGSHQRSGTNGEKGTGLGMPIVKRFVELHGGTLNVESRENKGTVFLIDLPMQQA